MELRSKWLHVRQRVLGPGADYVVTLADGGEIVFEAKSVQANVGHTFEMYDADGCLVASVHQHLLPVEPNYVIRREGISLGEVHRDLAAVTFPRFVLGGATDGLVLGADQSDFKFNLLFKGAPAARIERELSFVGTSYMVFIFGDVDIPTALCMLIAVDDALGQEAA